MLTRFQFACACVLITSLAAADEPTQTNDGANSVSPAVKELNDVTSRVESYLRALPAYSVKAVTKWTLDGPDTPTGMTQYVMSVRHPTAFRLEISSGDDDSPSLINVSDGTTLTRYYHHDPVAIYARGDGNLLQLLDDSLTNSSLKGSGLELIMRPNAHTHFMSSVSDVQNHGMEAVQGRQAYHFSAAWLGGQPMDFWISADQKPVLLKCRRQVVMEFGDQSRTMQIDTEFNWDLEAEPSADQFSIELPPGAVEVKDLQDYLLRGGTDQLLGQRAPDVSLQLLDGKPWNLAQHAGKQPVVLFFFATWAVPSTQDMPTILAFIEEYKQQGVAFYAVDVGDPSKDVREFVNGRGYEHPVVLDPGQVAAAAFRVTSLPVTILIGKDGTLQAVHVGTSPEDRALIRSDLKRIVAGEPLVEAQN